MSWPERVALVHDRLDQDGGAERVLWSLHNMFPEAPIFTSMWNRRLVPRFKGCDVRTSWMQWLPGIGRFPRAYAALYPLAFASLKLKGFDLVISSSSAFAKGIRVPTSTVHICYCHSPANFVWRPSIYFGSAAIRKLAWPLLAWLEAWDTWGAGQPDMYVANGRTVAKRILWFYGRDAQVIPPPVDSTWFTDGSGDSTFYLVVSRLVKHKRIDLAITACRNAGVPLVIVGEGRQERQLRRLARQGVSFLGRVSDSELRSLYGRTRALLVPGEEDFGIVLVEAQAAGTPVIAYDAGGATETVIDGITGIRFGLQTADVLAQAIRRASTISWDRDRIVAHAREYTEQRFYKGMTAVIERYSPDPAAASVPLGETAWR